MNKHINYQSDFKLFEKGDLNVAPFVFKYYTDANHEYIASYTNGEYKNCKLLDDGRLAIIFDEHGLPPGILRCRREYYLTDKDFDDGICNLVTVETTGIELVKGKTDGGDVEIQLPPHYQQGETGKALTWDDLTPEQQQGVSEGAADMLREQIVTYQVMTEEEYDALPEKKKDMFYCIYEE